MEAFEEFVKVFLEQQKYVVTGNIKFPVRQKTKKQAYDEWQTHGHEVDVVAARSKSLVLGTVKSFFGSGGVNKQQFKGIADESRKTHFKQFSIINDLNVQEQIIAGAADRFGYPKGEIQIWVFVGHFKNGHENPIREHLNQVSRNGVRMKVYGLNEIVEGVMEASKSTTYFNNQVVVALKCLREADKLK